MSFFHQRVHESLSFLARFDLPVYLILLWTFSTILSVVVKNMEEM